MRQKMPKPADLWVIGGCEALNGSRDFIVSCIF
jgi:hypothetical protein